MKTLLLTSILAIFSISFTVSAADSGSNGLCNCDRGDVGCAGKTGADDLDAVEEDKGSTGAGATVDGN